MRAQKGLQLVDSELRNLPFYVSPAVPPSGQIEKTAVTILLENGCQTSCMTVTSPFKKLVDQVLKLESQVESFQETF